ncbi:MAG: glycosyltransferase family 4 protein [Planctomycetia bacterium]
MLTVGLAAFLVALTTSALTTALMIRVAPTIGLMDRPAARKIHARPTPLGGGVAVYLGVVATLGTALAAAAFIVQYPQYHPYLPEMAVDHAAGVLHKTPLLAIILATATAQLILGLVDDYRRGGLSAGFRLLVEAGLVAVLITQGVSVTLFTDAFWITAPLTMLWIVGLTNSLNLLDNMDALAGGVAFIAAIFFTAVALLVGDLFVAGGFLTAAGAAAGFLIFNRPPARVFLGDAGSNFLGFWIGALTVVGTFNTPDYAHVTVLAPLCILAVPLYDTTTVVLLRISQGRSPFQPDKQHFSHRLVALGFSRTNAVLMIYLVCATTGLGGLLLYFVREEAALLILLQEACLLGIIALLELVGFQRTIAQAKETVPEVAAPTPVGDDAEPPR